MWKKSAAILLCIICFFCGCTQIVEPLVDQPVNSASEQPFQSAPEPLEKIEIKELPEIQIERREIEAKEVRYTYSLGVRKKVENALPQIIEFNYPYIYFQTMLVSDKSDGSIQVSRYSLKSKEVQILADLQWNAQFNTNEAVCLVGDEFLVNTVCKSEADHLTMDVAVINLQTAKTEIVYSHPVGNVFTYVKPIEKDAFVVFFYGQNDSPQKEIIQYIIYYDLVKRAATTIYKGSVMEWQDPNNSTCDIWAIDTFEDKVYIVLHQLVDGKMKTFLKSLNKQGNILFETCLDVLNEYSQKEYTVYNLAVEGNYVFLNYFQSGNNPPSVVLKKEGNVYNLMDMGQVYPKLLLSPGTVKSQYLYFSTYPQNWMERTTNAPSSNLLVFDSYSETAFIIPINCDTINEVVADINGNLIFSSFTEELEDHLYYLSYEDIISQMLTK